MVQLQIRGKPAANYELGLLINKPKLVWVHGPTKPGVDNDLGVFRQKLLPELANNHPGRKVIADSIYAAEADYVATKNDLDPPELQHFKNRVAARHETFNSFIKNWKCMRNRFRHGVEFHGDCFRAVCCVLMYQIDFGGNSLFDPYP